MGVIDGPVPCTGQAKDRSSSDLMRLCTEIEFLKILPQGEADREPLKPLGLLPLY